ncbi:MAG: hypothetical protein HGB10_05515 [Coriobacteriia bacterium]|nr:hypothetical protein [Coriobacteriia bacterium]
MGEFEPDAIDVTDEPVAEEAELECKLRRPLWLRVLRGVLITIVSVVAVGGIAALLLYNFGGMSGSAVPGVMERYDAAVAAGQAAPIQKRFVIGIPGCQCHSTDPTLTAQHSRRHMNECMKCHNTRPPHMEPGIL